MDIVLRSIAVVKNSRTTPTDDFWGTVISEIELEDDVPGEAFENISQFSHLEIIYFLDKAGENITFSGKPRSNPQYPVMGIFGQRKKDRPNTIGLCTVELIAHLGRKITVKYLDAIEGTPVLDIKPVFREFQPRADIKQPDWVSDLMKDYWK